MNESEMAKITSAEDRLQAILAFKNKIEELNNRVSHNLRGSLATVIGLIRVADRSSLTEENKMIFNWIEKKSEEMEVQIKSLSQELQDLSK